MKTINLNRREKYVVGGLVGFLLIFIVFRLVLYPLLDKQERLTRELTVKTSELVEMRRLQADYRILQEKAGSAEANLARRDRNFSLYSFLDSLARDIDIKVSSIDESSSTSSQGGANIKTATVKLKLQDITMEQLRKYLYRVEYSGNNLYIKRMAITETSKPEGYIDVQLQVETVVT